MSIASQTSACCLESSVASSASLTAASQAATYDLDSSKVSSALVTVAQQAATCGMGSIVDSPASVTADLQEATCNPGTPRMDGDSFSALVEHFPDAVNASQRLPKTRHGVEHYLATSGPPIIQVLPPRRQGRNLPSWSKTVLFAALSDLEPPLCTW